MVNSHQHNSSLCFVLSLSLSLIFSLFLILRQLITKTVDHIHAHLPMGPATAFLPVFLHFCYLLDARCMKFVHRQSLAAIGCQLGLPFTSCWLPAKAFFSYTLAPDGQHMSQQVIQLLFCRTP